MSALLERIIPHTDDSADVIAELQRLELRRCEISRATDRRMASLASVVQKTQAAYRTYCDACESDDTQKIEAAMWEWLRLAPAMLPAAQERAREQSQRNFGGDMTQFKSEFPGARNVLLAACKKRLAQAKEIAAAVLREETGRLQPLGYTAGEIAGDQRVSRASNRVRNLENVVLRRIENEGIETTWPTFAKEFLKDQRPV
jgi:hypothetical protein